MTGESERPAPPATPELSFEAALRRLEQAVTSLESGDLTLEQALAAFEEGMRMVRHCSERLQAAEARVRLLLADGEQGPPRSVPFPEESPEGGRDR